MHVEQTRDLLPIALQREPGGERLLQHVALADGQCEQRPQHALLEFVQQIHIGSDDKFGRWSAAATTLVSAPCLSHQALHPAGMGQETGA